MLLLYVFRLVIVALALGSLFMSAKKMFSSFKSENRFALGFCSVILAIPLFDYALGLVWVGVPIWIIKYVPILLSGIYLLLDRHIGEIMNMVKRLCIRFALSCRNTVKKHCGSRKNEFILDMVYKIAIATILLIVSVSVFRLAMVYSHIQLFGSDESHYLLQARYFAEDRNSFEIDNYFGEKDGTVLEDDHGPLWVVYLSDALIFGDSNDKNSPIVKCAQIVTAFLMLIVLLNTVDAIMGACAIWPTLIIALIYRYMMHFPLYGSRDGFRFVSLFLFISFIYELMCRSIKKDEKKAKLYSWKDYLVLALFSYFCLNGHGGNAYLISCIFIALFMQILVCKKQIKEIVLLGISVGTGMMFCLIKNFINYFNTGSFRSTTGNVYRGTAVVDVIRANAYAAVEQDHGNFLSTYTTEEKAILFFTAMVMLFVIVYCGIRIINRKKYPIEETLQRLMIVTSITICLYLPLTGILNFIAGNVQNWFLTQIRYRMYIYLSAALLCGVSYAFFAKKRALFKYISRALALIPCFLVLKTIHNYYPVLYANIATNEAVNFYIQTAEMVDEFIGEGYTLCNDQVFSWYLKKPAKFSSCEYMRPLYIANTEKEIEDAISELGIQVFVFDWRGDSYYKELPFYQYIYNNEKYNYLTASYTSNCNFEIFINHGYNLNEK